MMYYAAIKKTDVANGPGVRVSLFVSGCTRRCKGCFNAEAWDFSYGQPFDQKAMEEILKALGPDYISGFSVLGGEPFEPANRESVSNIVCRVRECFPLKTIWCYTGYHFEQDLLRWIEEGHPSVLAILQSIDILVDGRFLEEEKNLRLPFRGSENQRILDVKRSLEAGKAVEAK